MAEHPAVDGAALAVARNATLGDREDPRLVRWLVDDQVALYEWAKSVRRPSVNAVGQIVPDHWVYPSRSEALRFLADYRAERQRRFEARSGA